MASLIAKNIAMGIAKNAVKETALTMTNGKLSSDEIKKKQIGDEILNATKMTSYN